MSLLERLGRGHLSDRQFARLWTSGANHPHLDGCDVCRARFQEFELWVTGLADELHAEAENAVSAERLAVQQAQIARRLESLEKPGRIIAFPKAARAVINGHSHVRRWVTVAAAAGLIAGIGLDQLMPVHRGAGIPQGQTFREAQQMSTPEAAARARTLKPVSTSQSDDDLLSDALVNPQVKDLRALDDMTPRVRDMGR